MEKYYIEVQTSQTLKTKLYVAGFCDEHAVVQNTNSMDYTMFFDDPMKAEIFIKKYADCGYGLNSEDCKIVPYVSSKPKTYFKKTPVAKSKSDIVRLVILQSDKPVTVDRDAVKFNGKFNHHIVEIETGEVLAYYRAKMECDQLADRLIELGLNVQYVVKSKWILMFREVEKIKTKLQNPVLDPVREKVYPYVLALETVLHINKDKIGKKCHAVACICGDMMDETNENELRDIWALADKVSEINATK